MVHLLRGDVVIDDGLAVLQGRGVRVAADEVRRVQVWVGGAGGQVPGQVVGCQGGREGGSGGPRLVFVLPTCALPASSPCIPTAHTDLKAGSLTMWDVCCQGFRKQSLI